MPGGAIVGDSAEVVPAKGATRPNRDTVQGHARKFVGMARICVDTNTGDGNLGF